MLCPSARHLIRMHYTSLDHKYPEKAVSLLSTEQLLTSNETNYKRIAYLIRCLGLLGVSGRMIKRCYFYAFKKLNNI